MAPASRVSQCSKGNRHVCYISRYGLDDYSVGSAVFWAASHKPVGKETKIPKIKELLFKQELVGGVGREISNKHNKEVNNRVW